MFGVHGMLVGTDKIAVQTIQVDLDKVYQMWEKKEGKAGADARLAKFIPVPFVPEKPAYVKGKGHQLYINPKTKEMWYEEKDRGLSNEEAMSDLATALASQNSLISAKLDQLIQLQTEANNLKKSV